MAATHGRSLWVLDVTTLRQLSAEKVAEPVVLYAPAPAVQWRPEPGRGATRTFTGRNPAAGAQLYYALAKKVPGVKLEVLSREGEVLRTLEAKAEAGLHRVTWDLRGANKPDAQGRRRRVAPRVQPGRFVVRLTVGESEHTQPIEVQMDPAHPDPGWMVHEDEAEEQAAARAAGKARRHVAHGEGRDE